jgi:hypothetical protein
MFRAADGDTDNYLAVSKGRERLAVNKHITHTFHMERFNLKKLNEVEGKVQYHVEISNRFTALENLDAGVDINRSLETVRENIKILAKESLGYYELKKHKPWFSKGCSKLLDQRKQAILQWLQDPSKINGDNLNNIRLETCRQYVIDIIDELATNSKNQNIRDLYRGINYF